MSEKKNLSLELTEEDMSSMDALGKFAQERGVEELIDPFYLTLKEDGNDELVDEHIEDITELLRDALQMFFSRTSMDVKKQKIRELIRLLVDLGITFDVINRAYFRLFVYSMGVVADQKRHMPALVKTMYLWSMVTIEVFYAELETTKELVEEISAPIQQVWDKVISVSIVGQMDSNRFAVMEENVLEAVSAYSAAFVILDVVGLDHLDSDVASHFVKMIQAINLMGTGVIMVGVGSAISRAFVRLDIGLNGLRLSTFATFKQGLVHAFDQLGVTTLDRRSVQ